MSVQRKFDLKSQECQNNIALHEIQLPINYIHFEITFYKLNLIILFLFSSSSLFL